MKFRSSGYKNLDFVIFLVFLRTSDYFRLPWKCLMKKSHFLCSDPFLNVGFFWLYFVIHPTCFCHAHYVPQKHLGSTKRVNFRAFWFCIKMCLAKVRETGICVYVGTSKTARGTKKLCLLNDSVRQFANIWLRSVLKTIICAKEETAFYGLFFFSVLKGMNYNIV